MILTIQKNILSTDTSFLFDKEESRHLIKVLRKKENDIIYITDGIGHLFEAKITLANEKKCEVAIQKVDFFAKNRPYSLHIAIAPTKLNDRYEWFLEKATEIGVDEITPIICKNSERKVINLERMEKIIHAATKQSLQYHLPILNPAMELNDFIKNTNTTQKYIAHCEDANNKTLLHHIATPTDSITILIGPEGDFSPKEIQKAIELNFLPVSLGENRLRTETAGVYVTTLMTLLK